MSEKDMIEFKILEAKSVGSDSVVFHLEDGAIVKVKVDIGRAAIALNYRNPDGTPHYNISVSNNISIISPERTFKIPRDRLKIQKDLSQEKGEPYK